MTGESQSENNGLLLGTAGQAKPSAIPSQLDGMYSMPEAIEALVTSDKSEVRTEVGKSDGLEMLYRLKREAKITNAEKQHIVQRRAKVAALTQAGLGTEEIAKVLACSQATVAVDRREIGIGFEQKPHQKALYPLRFRFLALFESSIDISQSDVEPTATSGTEPFEIYTADEKSRLRNLLRTSLGIEKVLAANEPVTVSNELFTDDEKLKGFARLANAVLQVEEKTKVLASDQVSAAVRNLLVDIADGQSFPPETREMLPRMIGQRCRQSVVGPLRRAVDSELVEFLSAALLNLASSREASVLSMRFGLKESGKVITLEGIGNEWGTTRERVRQIEAKALRHMREPALLSALKPYAEFADERKVVIDPKDKVQYLGEYGLSLSAVRLLVNARIRSIGELHNHLVDESNGWMLRDVFAVVSEVQKNEARLAIQRYQLAQLKVSKDH